MSKSKTCFVISPIGEADSSTRKRADEVFEYIIRPSVSEMGYTATRADHIDKSGIITTQIIQNLLESDLVVADLSERNPNVLYELAVRHYSRMPFIQIITSGETIPFDVAANRTVQYDTSLSGAAEAKRQIQGQINSIHNGTHEVENPIINTVDLSTLRKSSDSSDRTMATLIESVNNIGAAVARLEGAKDNSRSASASDEVRRYRTLIANLNEEIQKIKISKSRVDYQDIKDESDLYTLTSNISKIFEHIISERLPKFDTNQKYRDKLSMNLEAYLRTTQDLRDEFLPF